MLNAWYHFPYMYFCIINILMVASNMTALALLLIFKFHRLAQVHPEYMWQTHSGEPLENVILHATLFSMTSLAVGQWWSSMEEHEDVYRVSNGTLTAVRYWDKILMVQCVLGFPASCDEHIQQWRAVWEAGKAVPHLPSWKYKIKR